MLKVVRYGPADAGAPGKDCDTEIADGVDVTRARDGGSPRVPLSLGGAVSRLNP